MIISDIKRNDNDLIKYLENCVEEDKIYKYSSTVSGVISHCKSSGNNIMNYPKNTLDILKKLNPNSKCIVYESYRDGWGCTYIFIGAIIINKN